MLAQILRARENDKIFLGLVVFVYFLLLTLRGNYVWFEGAYDPKQLYLFSVGPLDFANDKNFATIKRNFGQEIASNIAFRRIVVSNIVFFSSAACAVFFLPFYVNWLEGKYFAKKDFRIHIIGYLTFLVIGFLVFWNLYMTEDYLYAANSVRGKYSVLPEIKNWWKTYSLGQASMIVWFGMVFSIVVVLAKSLISMRVVEEDDTNS